MSGISKNKIKWVKSLHVKKYRDSEGLYLVEGEKMVEEALNFCPADITELYTTSPFKSVPKGLPQHLVSEKELEQISTLRTPNKSVAILKKQSYNLPDKVKNIGLVLDGIQDPGNLGTILRIADWYGITDVICSPDTVDCYNPKVVQASMGAIFRVRICYADLATFIDSADTTVYGALLEGKNVYTEHLVSPALLLLGNEGNGISKNLIKKIDKAITIPRFGHAESLNVSVATGILVSEFFRK